MINLHSPYIKEFLKYLGWILLFVFLWFRGCSGSLPSTQIAKVIIPEVKAKFEAKKPVHEAIVINANNKANMQKGKTVFVENPINENLIAENEKLKKDFAKADSSTKDVIFEKVATLNKFSTKFEDENLLININGIVQGEVKEITPNYTIKEKKIEVPIKLKETVFRVLGGIEVGNNAQLNAFKLKANLMFQNRKGNIISGSFDTNQTIWVGFNVSIFDVKR